jgi:hypothetical protein
MAGGGGQRCGKLLLTGILRKRVAKRVAGASAGVRDPMGRRLGETRPYNGAAGVSPTSGTIEGCRLARRRETRL